MFIQILSVKYFDDHLYSYVVEQNADFKLSILRTLQTLDHLICCHPTVETSCMLIQDTNLLLRSALLTSA